MNYNHSIHFNNISFGQKYRIILTQQCQRKCPNCVNTVDGVLSHAIHLKLAEINANGDTIVLTGGEPAIYSKLVQVVSILKKTNPLSKLLIYTSKATKKLLNVMNDVDGITYTLHYPFNKRDAEEFQLFQEQVKINKKKDPSKSYRLYVDSRIDTDKLRIDEKLYSRYSIIKWMLPEEILSQKDKSFGVPKSEQLVLLDE